MSHSTLLIMIIALGVVALALLSWAAFQNRRTKRLQNSFGPEYDTAVQQIGDRRKAEAALEARKKRVEKLRLRTLSAEEQARFGNAWKATQTRFVDDPRGAVADADHLVTDLVQARGYPVADFEQRAADISVDHPRVVSNYRSAREIAGRCAEGRATTEDLRQAIMYYRALFEELLEMWPAAGVA